uniref:ATP synthase complex subunit 8 n=1 Tax=Proasellus rectus TaxID=1282025 RepID=A0A485M9A4_9CRUS|nr:ATP synthase 8 [Proasellus rectus]
MPQMAPMFWTMLMLLFTLAFLTLMAKLYFYPFVRPPYLPKSASTSLKNQWLW